MIGKGERDDRQWHTRGRSLDQLRNRVQLRTRIRRMLGQPLWEQLAGQARSSADRVGFIDQDEATLRIVEKMTPYTKTGPVRVVALCTAIDYIVQHEIPGRSSNAACGAVEV